MAAAGYPGWQGNTVGGGAGPQPFDVEQGGYGGGGYAAPPPPAGYGGAPAPQAGYGGGAAQQMGYAQATAGGYGRPNVQAAPPPPRPPPASAAVAEASAAARHGFIRKVYSILTLQLLITFGVIAAFTYVVPLRDYILDYQGGRNWFMWTFLALSVATLIALTCCGNLAQRFPINLILLFVFTVFESLCLGGVSAMYACNAPFNELYSVETYRCGSNNMNICQKYILNEGVCNTGDGLPGSALVMIAVGVTVVVVLGLTLFAFQTKWDFTGAAPYMMVALLCLLMFGLIGGIWLRRYWTFNIIYAILGTLLFSFYLVFDTQLIIGGKHRKYQYGLDDFIFAALSLYLDVVNLFLMILSIVGLSSNAP